MSDNNSPSRFHKHKFGDMGPAKRLIPLGQALANELIARGQPGLNLAVITARLGGYSRKEILDACGLYGVTFRDAWPDE